MDKVSIPKVLAVFLPQFYRTAENDVWWGDGFTDWTSVKKAQKLFDDHYEPKIPLRGNYYDLSRVDTLIKQAELARKHHVDGFCFYHYYFKNGKKLLNLPAENLLAHKEIDIDYCFNWASEPWVRSWSNIKGNVWAEKYEKGKDKKNRAVLVEQDYGNREDWEKHFYYLLPFFRDKRYIKIDKKPVFIFYSPSDINVLKEMVECWRDLALKNGIHGLYLIGAYMDAPNKALDAAIIYEPRNSFNALKCLGETSIKNGIRCYEYSDVWNNLIKANPFIDYKTFFCGIIGYDDTPRRGRNGECIINRSIEVFVNGLRKLLEKSIFYHNEIVFINAWNEWGEGMYLEPDEMNGDRYLKALERVILELRDMNVSDMEYEADIKLDVAKKQIEKLVYECEKYKNNFYLLDKWLNIERYGNAEIKNFLNNNNIKSLAIYGLGIIGKQLLSELKKQNISVKYGIDQYVGDVGGLIVYRPEDELPIVDAIIITTYDTLAVRQCLAERFDGLLFTINDVLNFGGEENNAYKAN